MKTKTNPPSPEAKTKKNKQVTPASASPIPLEDAFERYRPEAEALDALLVEPMRADLPLALHNAEKCVAAIVSHERTLANELPALDCSVLTQLPDIVRATMYAAQQVSTTDKPSDVQDNIVKARAIRKLMLHAADSLVLAGMLPKKEVEAIRKGTGLVDTANDCVALAALFRNNPKAQSQSPITATQIAEASTLGTQLLSQLTPKGSKKAANNERVSAVDLRDRLWTLAVLRYRDVWRAGAYLFGPEEIDAQVPPLLTRVAGKKKTLASPESVSNGPEVTPSEPSKNEV